MIPLLCILIMASLLGLATLLSPDMLRWLAARLAARAEAIDASRAAYQKGVEQWTKRFGIEEAQP